MMGVPIAHRGLHGSNGTVENSIGAAEAAIAAGYGIECDIRLSRDGEAMVFHDERLERLTKGSGRLQDHEAATLTAIALRGGPDRIPTLAAFLDAIGGRAPLVIELKSAGNGNARLAERAVAQLAGYPGAVALESFDQSLVMRCRALRAPCPVGLVGPPGDGEDTAHEDRDFSSHDFLSWAVDHVEAIAARYPDMPLTTWTVRTPEQQARAARAKAQIIFENCLPLTTR